MTKSQIEISTARGAVLRAVQKFQPGSEGLKECTKAADALARIFELLGDAK